MEKPRGGGESVEDAEVASGELFVRVHSILRKESLAHRDDMATLARLTREIKEKSLALAEEATISRLSQQIVERVLSKKLDIKDWPTEAELLRFEPQCSLLGSKVFDVAELLSIVKREPDLLAIALTATPLSALQLDLLPEIIVMGVFRNFHMPHEERSLLALIDRTTGLQMAAAGRPADFVKRVTVAMKLFVAYAKSYSSGKRFLSVALRPPILELLSEYDMDLDLNPTTIFARLSEDQRQRLYLANVPQDALASHPSMAPLMAEVQDKVVSICESFIASIHRHVSIVPYGVRWLCKRMVHHARSIQPDFSADATAMLLGETFFRRFVIPAIITPEPFGVIADAPISAQARRNLTLIAKVLQGVCSLAPEKVLKEPYLAKLAARVAKIRLDGLFAELVDVVEPDVALAALPDEDLRLGRPDISVLSVPQLVAFHELLASSLTTLHQTHGATHPISKPLDRLARLPELAAAHDHRTFYVFAVGSSSDDIGFVDEKAFAFTSQPLQDPDQGAVLLAAERLRRVMTGMSLDYQFRGRFSRSILEAKLGDAAAADPVAMAVIAETIRALERLPAKFSQGDFAPLFVVMLQEHTRREEYRAFVQALRRKLLLVLADVAAATAAVQAEQETCVQYRRQTKIRALLDRHEDKVSTFLSQFHLTDLDKRQEAIAAFLATLKGALLADPMWVTEGALATDVGAVMLEKFVMTRLFDAAFVTETAAKPRLSIVPWLTTLLTIEPTDPALQIHERFLGEAPWSLAQSEIRKINAYKAPADKMRIVRNTAKVIMELLSLSGVVPGADDVFPVFVYVLAHAAVPMLSENAIYIERFGSQQLQPEDSYWLTQLQTCLHFMRELATQRGAAV